MLRFLFYKFAHIYKTRSTFPKVSRAEINFGKVIFKSRVTDTGLNLQIIQYPIHYDQKDVILYYFFCGAFYRVLYGFNQNDTWL
jgi:hypothetical protein